MAQIVLTREKRPAISEEFTGMSMVLNRLLDEYDGQRFTEDEFAAVIFHLVGCAVAEFYDPRNRTLTLEMIPEIYTRVSKFTAEVLIKFIEAYAADESMKRRIALKMNAADCNIH